jgi:hypothetical protein
MILEAFNPAHFHPEERLPLQLVREGMLLVLPERPLYLVLGPVNFDGYQKGGRTRVAMFADRITREGKRGPLTVTTDCIQLVTVRRPGAGTDLA